MMSPEQKKELVRHWYEDVLSGLVNPREPLVTTGGRDSEEAKLKDMFHSNYVNHVAPEPPGGWKKGVEGARQIIKAYRLSFPDLTLRVTNQVVGGDLVMTQYTITGTHIAKSFFGAAATGKIYHLSGLGVDRITDGKFAESWGAWDTYGLMEQMGILPKAAHLSA